MKFRSLVAYLLLSAAPAAAQGAFDDGVIRIGVINDRTGPYSDLSGEGSVVAARMAAEEFENSINGTPIEIVFADHQNKPDVGAAIIRKWLADEGVDAVVDFSNSGITLAAAALLKEHEALVITNASSNDITGKSCHPHMMQWLYNARSTATNVITADDIAGGMDKFFIVAVDNAAGTSASEIFSTSVQALGGSVVGQVVHPLNTSDFSSYFLQAKGSGADAIFLANMGSDLGNSSKQAAEFGVTRTQNLIAGALTISEIEANGLEALQGLRAISFYEWNRNNEAKNWALAFAERHGGRLPAGPQAATYSQVRHMLAAMQAVGSDSPEMVAAKMREMPVNDAFSDNGVLRKDGQLVHDMYIIRVKTPSESTENGDYTERLKILPGELLFQSLEESECPTAK